MNMIPELLIDSMGLIGIVLAICSVLVVASHQIDLEQCGRRKTGRIIGGWAPGVNEYPMIAALVRDQPQWSACSGTIVSKNHAVTAAHCVHKQLTEWVKLLVGSQDYSKFPDTPYSKLYTVDRFIVHPGFTGTGTNDVALVRTQNSIEFNVAVGPVCLPFGNEQYTGQYVDILGWGRTSNSGPLSPVLQKTTVSVMKNSDCSYYYGSFVTPAHICTFTVGRDFCIHDSGGPLFTEVNGRVTLVGIIGYGGCLTGKPGGALRVSAYSRWIYDTSRN